MWEILCKFSSILDGSVSPLGIFVQISDVHWKLFLFLC